VNLVAESRRTTQSPAGLGVGPLSSVDGSDRVVAAIQTFVARAIGAA
jgi:hypothetical protein